MKLLLDENLSRRIVPLLQQDYPGSSHVGLLGLEQKDDREVWAFAKDNDYVIVTKDDDFQGLLALFGYPPKVIRLRMGNCSNQRVGSVLLDNLAAITKALEDSEIGILDLY